MNQEFQAKYIERILTLFVIIVSTSVAFAWISDLKFLLSIIQGSATMKFNTALLFLLTSLSAILIATKKPHFVNVSYGILFIILGISLVSFLSYFTFLPIDIDNLFVFDKYSPENPGRMSPATATSFFVTALGALLIQSKNINFKRLGQVLFLIVTAVATLSIITFVLGIPAKNKTLFFQTMAIHTSLLFLICGVGFSLKNSGLGFMGLLLGEYAGSKLIRVSLPAIVIIPVILSYFLIFAFTAEYANTDFGVVIYTLVFIVLAVAYFSLLSVRLNKADMERKSFENQVKRNNKELKQFKDALDTFALIVITNPKGIITKVNQHFCTTSKYSEEELIGQPVSIIKSDYHSEDFHKTLWTNLEQGNVWVGEIKNKAKDGSTFWVQSAIVPSIDANGNIKEYLCIKTDISSKKEAEELLSSQLVQRLTHKNNELEQFTFIASHDLQEPLRTVTSFSEILKMEYAEKLDEEGHKFLQFILDASGRMTNLIKGLLDYSRIGKQESAIEVDCNQLLQHITEDLSSAVTNSNATIKYGNLPTVKAYSTSIRLLFQNLLSNALKFRKPDTDPLINVSAKPVEHGWQFSIEDNGIGIKEEYRDKIFTIFQRLHLKNEYEGTGIGLSHCRKVVEMHGGKIWVENAPNGGSIFHFTITNNLEI